MATPSETKNKTEYAYVMASTLNQMVNYIPLCIEFEEKKLLNIYNITLKKGENGKIKDNNDWDENFKNVINKKFPVINIEIDQKDWLNVENTTKQIWNIISKETKPIFWNITGGQRPYLMAVLELTKNRPKDIIAYLEGNTGKIVQLKQSKEDGLVSIDGHTSYAIEGLTIEIALKLMGFDVSKDGKSRTEGFKTLKEHSDRSFFTKFADEMVNNDALRLALLETNKPDKKEAAITRLKTELSCKFTPSDLETLNKYLNQKATYPFGYILEYMAAFRILSSNIVDKIADMSVSTSLYFTDKVKQKEGGGSSLDEFDIAILTKTGQLIIIECKSGIMSGDVAKSTKYSTYAIAGVYGKPILVTPLKSEEINDFANKSISDEAFNNIKTAIRSARRATLEVWGIDEIASKLEEKLKAK